MIRMRQTMSDTITDTHSGMIKIPSYISVLIVNFKQMKKALFLLGLFLSLSVFSQEKISTVIILHVNDLHAKIERMPELKHKVDSIRSIYDDVFLFSAGDLFSGNPFVDRHSKRGYPIIDLMNDVGFDLTAVGNHEFDYGQKVLSERISEAKFPFISANIVSESPRFKQPKGYHVFKTKSGLSLGVVSLIQVEKNGYPSTHPKNLQNLKFLEPLNEAKAYKKKLKGTDAQIALTHLGYKQDMELAKQNQWLELVVGGHSHTTLNEAVKVGNVIVTQAGSDVKYLGVAKLVFKGDKLQSVKDELLSLKNQTKDPKAQEKVKKYTNNPEFRAGVAFLPYTLGNEKEIGLLMAQAYQKQLNVDIVLQNLGGVRVKTLKEGILKLIDLMRLDPFNNEMVTFKMYPKEIVEFLRYADGLERKERIIAAGMKMEYIRNEKGELVDIKLMDSKGEMLLENGMYTVAINSYMTDSFTFSAKSKAERTGKFSNDLLVSFFKEKFPIR